MVTLATVNPTILDLARQTNPDGTQAAIAEILSETNEILPEMTVIEGNQQSGHLASVRTGLPTPTWRKIGGFVTPGKGTQAQVQATCGMLEAFAEQDKALVDMAADPAQFRLNEDRAQIEGMNIEMADTLFYGNEDTESEAFTGLSPHYNSLTAASGGSIINASGDSDYRSIWLICWSPMTVFGITPKHSIAGLQSEDLGLVTLQSGADETGGSAGRMRAYQSHYRWDLGLMVKDWRYAVRIANIDFAAISTTYTSGTFSAGPDLSDLMFQAHRRIPNLNMGRCAWYMSRDMLTKLSQQNSAKTQGSTLQVQNVGGQLVETFLTIPVRRVDALSSLETVVA